MPAPVAVRPRETLKQSLRALDIGPDHTTSSALGPDHVRADVRLWDTFEDEVRGWFIDGQGIDWARLTHTITYRPQTAPGDFNTLREHVGCGDEGGVEGRIQANIGQPVSAVYKAAGMGLKFGDYHVATNHLPCREQPDIAIVAVGGEIRAVMEVKTPWVHAHDLNEAVEEGGEWLRNVLAQEARYMQEGRLKYGVVSTYAQTVWLKQEEVEGERVLFYTGAIFANASYADAAGPGESPKVTVRECFGYLGHLLNEGHTANNPMPVNHWVA